MGSEIYLKFPPVSSGEARCDDAVCS
jgi:hypothetical protein